MDELGKVNRPTAVLELNDLNRRWQQRNSYLLPTCEVVDADFLNIHGCFLADRILFSQRHAILVHAPRFPNAGVIAVLASWTGA